MRVLIVAGGKGTRMSLGEPKSLLRINDLPLIGYQLQELHKVSPINEVMVSVNTEAQQEAFIRAVERYKLPQFKYETSIHTYGHQMNAFLEGKVKDFVAGHDFLWSYGDVMYSSNLVKSLISLHSEQKATVITLGKPKYIESVLYGMDKGSKVITDTDEAKMGLHMPILVDGKDVAPLIRAAELGRREDEFIINMLRQDRVYGVRANLIFNINTVKDVENFKEYLKEINNKQ